MKNELRFWNIIHQKEYHWIPKLPYIQLRGAPNLPDGPGHAETKYACGYVPESDAPQGVW